jgi:hypothetical protein
MVVLFFVNLVGLAVMIFKIKDFFAIEFFALLVFIVSSIVILYYIYKNRMAAWIMSLLFFAAYLINITLLYFYFQNQLLFVVLIFSSVVGFILSIENIKHRKISTYEREIIKEAKELTKAEEELEKKTPEISLNESKSSKYFFGPKERKIKKETRKKPVKKKTTKKAEKLYIASRKGTNYHVPECRWARKILSKRKVTFKTKKDAEKEGFKPCDCVK